MTGTRPAAVPFQDALRFWLKLGFISFGGPAGQISVMHQELVERRRWISEKRFLHALNYCMLLPGPEAQQLATYIGWLLHRTRGGIVAGTLFVLPSFVILVLLAWTYVAYGHTPVVSGLFYGIKPAVTAIVLHAAHRIGSRTLRHPLAWGIAISAFLASAVLQAPFPLVIAVAAIAGLAGSGSGRVHSKCVPATPRTVLQSRIRQPSWTMTRPRPRTRGRVAGTSRGCLPRQPAYGRCR